MFKQFFSLFSRPSALARSEPPPASVAVPFPPEVMRMTAVDVYLHPPRFPVLKQSQQPPKRNG